MYIGPEFQLGQVYDGTVEFSESILLYRPVYITVVPSGTTASTPGPSSSGSTKIKSQKSSLRGAPTTSSKTEEPPSSDKKPMKPHHRASEKASRVQKLNALAVAPPSLQTIAKKRSSLPDSTKPFDPTKPFSRFEFSSFKKEDKRSTDKVNKLEAETTMTIVNEPDVEQPCTSAQAIRKCSIGGLATLQVKITDDQIGTKDNDKPPGPSGENEK